MKFQFLQNKYLALFLFFLSFLCMLMIALMSVNTFYHGDDYAFMTKLNKYGVIGNCIYGYNTWDGRFFSLMGFLQNFLLHYSNVKLATFIWSLSFMISGLYIFKIVNLELNLNFLSSIQKTFLTILFSVIFWMGCYTHFSQTIYWATGGGYSFDLLLCAIWVFYYLKYQKFNLSTINIKIIFLFFTIILGASTQNLTLGLLALTFLGLISDKLNKKQNLIYNILIILCLIIGFCIISFAPGNLVRLKAGGFNNSHLSIVALIKSFIRINISYFKISLLLFLITSISTFLIFQLFNFKLKLNFHFKFNNFKSFFNLTNEYFKWFIVAISTSMPFIVNKGFATPRTALFFMYFIMLFLIITIYKIFFQTVKINDLQTNSRGKEIVLSSPLLVIFISIFLFQLYNFNNGVIINDLISKREEKLINGKGKVVEIKVINDSLKSPCYDFNDLVVDENDMVAYRRLRLQEYYKVKKIIVIN